jgi:hypothetical protein
LNPAGLFRTGSVSTHPLKVEAALKGRWRQS